MLSGTILALFVTALTLSPAAPPAEPVPTGSPWLDIDVVALSCSAQTTCSSGATISCDAGSGATCTSQNGVSVTCGSCSITCASVNPWYNCQGACIDAREACVAACPHKMPYFEYCLDDCLDDYAVCLAACGPAPPTHCSG